MIGDAFRRWTSSPDWSSEKFDQELTVSKLFSIQTEFYGHVLDSFKYHVIYFCSLALFFVFYSKSAFRDFVRSFLLSISVKTIFIPLLIWTQTGQNAFFGPFIFTKLISISFLALQMDLLRQSAHGAKHSVGALSYTTCPIVCLFFATLSVFISEKI